MVIVWFSFHVPLRPTGAEAPIARTQRETAAMSREELSVT
jgi:hypothetical protein